LKCDHQLYPSPQLKGDNLIIIDNPLQSEYFLTISLRATILSLMGIFYCDDSLEGMIGDFNVHALFRYRVNLCDEKVSYVSKDILGNDVHNCVDTNDFYVPYSL
jgi:hypothetical protein